MHPAIPQLLELQRLDQLLASWRTSLEAIPKRLKDADAKLTGARSAVAAAKEALSHGLTTRKKLELDAEQWKDRAKKYRAQTSSVKTNEAYKALQHEIANADGEASKAEDAVLEQMMALEELDRRLRHAEADLKESETAIQAEKKMIDDEFADKKKSWLEANAERKALAAKLPADIQQLYDRVSKKHPASALAQVRNNQCRGCGVRVLPHTIQLLESDTDEELFRCESCGRILYSLEPISHAASGQASDAAAS